MLWTSLVYWGLMPQQQPGSSFESISDVMLDSPSTTLYTYGTKGSRCKLPVVGTLKCKVFAGTTDKMCHTVFHVINGQAGNLLSCDTSTKLGLISFAKSVESESVSDRKSCQAVRVGDSTNPIVKEYADRLQGIGQMKDTKVELHIADDVKPVVQKLRRVPFNVRLQVEQELDRLEKLDIIEKAEGATPWISPLVVVYKKEGGCICIATRARNMAIQRERW